MQYTVLYENFEVKRMDEKMLLEAIGQLMDAKLQVALEPIKADVSGIKSDLAEVKQRTTKIEVTLENDIAKRLKTLGEGQDGVNEKFTLLDEVAERVEDIQITVNAMEAVTKQNCSDIKQLRAVK